MPLSIPRLRRWFAGSAIVLVMTVAGVYFYARHRVQNARKQVPEKIGLEIKQSATGFTISKSEQGRTLFKIEAGKAMQFRQSGHAELHDVAITVYGRDSSRYDQIYGSEFDYDPQSGEVTARGEVQIDLEANPEGILNPDQAPPKELKNPIHLKTSGLVFNQKTGNAYTKQKIEFRLPEVTGSAMGMTYVARTNLLTLQSQVKVATSSLGGATLTAAGGTIAQNPRQVVLDHPRLDTSVRRCESDTATLFLRSDNTLDRIVGSGNVSIETQGSSRMEAGAERAEIIMARQHDTIQTATLSGNVTADVQGTHAIHATAGRVVLSFGGKNLLTQVHSEENVKLVQHQDPPSSAQQDLQLTASSVDFFLANGGRLKRAETSGAAQIAIGSDVSGSNSRTLVTAGKFEGHFGDSGQLLSVHGAPDARIVNQNSGQPDRASSSRTLDVTFHRVGGIGVIEQQGSVAYVDGQRRAWSDRARYTPADQLLILTGSPRVVEDGMTTTSHTMRLNRGSGEVFAEGDVKTTYSDLKPQPGGALLASSSPIHVTARSMTVRGAAAVAQYMGDVRLWQDANAVEAPAIDFDKDRRAMDARGSPSQLVSTVLVQTDKNGKSTPVALTSSRLTYTDNERKAHFEENVVAKGADVMITAKQVDAFLAARGQAGPSQPSGAGKLDKIVAAGQVVVTEPGRRATGDQLVYTAAEDKFVLSGGFPSIFDAEHGKITGVSLTFFRHDDRVLVEGSSKSPTVTQTRVAR